MSKLRVISLVLAVLVVAGCSDDRNTAAGTGPTASPGAGGTAAGSPSGGPGSGGTASGGPVSGGPASGGPSGAPATGVSTLPGGKGDFPLAAGTWRSPAGFAPALRITLPAGWTSVHRGADAFDIGQPDPAKDAPLAAIVFLTPRERTAAAALTDVSTRANGDVQPTPGQVGAVTADGVDIVGGSGQLIASASGGIALDAADGQHVRLLTLTAAGKPLVVAVVVPESAQWDAIWPGVESILATVKFG